MKRTSIPPTVVVVSLLAALTGIALAAQDRDASQAPGGLAVSQNGQMIKTILGNPEMIGARRAFRATAKPVPDGDKMARIPLVREEG